MNYKLFIFEATSEDDDQSMTIIIQSSLKSKKIRNTIYMIILIEIIIFRRSTLHTQIRMNNLYHVSLSFRSLLNIHILVSTVM